MRTIQGVYGWAGGTVLANLDLNLLLTLDVLLTERNVTRAAEQLGVSQPAVSAALARLRRHFGDELLDRVGNRYELTPLAAQLRPRPRSRWPRSAGSSRHRHASTRRPSRRSSRSSCPTTPPWSWARSCHAPRQLRTTRAAADPVADAVRRRPRRRDAAPRRRGGPAARLRPGLPHTDLFEDDWVGIAAADNPLLDRRSDARAAPELPWVLTFYSRTAFTPAQQQLRMIGVEPRVVVVGGDFLPCRSSSPAPTGSPWCSASSPTGWPARRRPGLRPPVRGGPPGRVVLVAPDAPRRPRPRVAASDAARDRSPSRRYAWSGDVGGPGQLAAASDRSVRATVHRVKAAVHTSYGPPDVVRVIDVPKPTIRAVDVLIKVVATTVNRTDCAYRAAKPFFVRAATGLRRPRRTVLGTEFAGVVEDVGSAVTSLFAGDPVFGYCEGQFGAQAEYLAVPHDSMLAAMPHECLLRGGRGRHRRRTLRLAFLTRAQIRAGQDVLVNGATGAIGSAAVQLLKVLGAHVTAVCPVEHVALVRRLGADRVIDCDHEDFTATDGFLRRHHRRRREEHLRALQTAAPTPRGLQLLRPRAVLAEPAAVDGHPAGAPPARSSSRFPGRARRSQQQLRELLQSGQFTPVIDRRYSSTTSSMRTAMSSRGARSATS